MVWKEIREGSQTRCNRGFAVRGEGAEVIKVEPPEGDPARSRSCAIHGTGVVFLANNRNKQSVCIDLKSASGQRQAHELLRTAYLDVAMTDALLGMQHIQALAAEEFGVETGVEELTGSLVCYSLYETRDDRLVSLAALEEKFWSVFCESVAKPGWISYQFTLTTENKPVYGEVKKLFKAHDLAFWTRFGERTDCCLQPTPRKHRVRTNARR